jgi:hypothetical protein
VGLGSQARDARSPGVGAPLVRRDVRVSDKQLEDYMRTIQTIEMAELRSVLGGNGEGPNRVKAEGELNVKSGPVNVSGKGSYSSSSTDYKACLDNASGKNASVQETLQMCGQPPGARQGQ